MNKYMSILIIAVSVLVFCFAETALADQPRVLNVIPWDSGGNHMLNMTLYHALEGSSHFVDNIMIDVTGDVQSFPQGGAHAYYDPAHSYFNVTIGPIAGIVGTPAVTVKAHCIIHGWSTENWTGTIPEFPSVTLLMMLVFCSSTAVLVLRRTILGVRRQLPHVQDWFFKSGLF